MARLLGRVSDRTWFFLIALLGAWRPLIWIVAEWGHCQAGVCQVSGTPPEWDFAIFWQAGRLAAAGDFATIFRLDLLRAFIAGRAHYDIGDSPFPYPPPSLLLLAPLARLPLGWAYALWVAGGAAALVAALRGAGLGWRGCLFVLASPAFLYDVMLGQNGAYTAALLLGALRLAAAWPERAGGLAAILLLKPQMALLLPAAWLGGRRWRAIFAAAAWGLGIILASVLAFGLAPWRLYLVWTMPEMARIMNAPAPQFSQTNSITSFVLLRALGLSVAAARWAMAGLAVGAGAVIYAAARGVRDWLAPAGLTVCLSLLIMPYGHGYDMVAYAGILALVAQRLGPSPMLAALWVWPAFARDVMVQLAAPLTPVVVAVAAVWIWGRLEQRKQELLF